MTKRAREAALAAVSRPRGGSARAVAIGGTLLAAVAVGVVIGSFAFAGRGTAGEPRGLGFLPAEGWTVLQSGTPATPDRPGVAVAANVPLHPQDTVDGFPYSTLRSLPPHGVVLVASFMRLSDPHGASQQLPLSLREAEPYIRYGGEVRPERPLGQYELRAMVEGYAVEVQAYFGTREPPSAQLAEAQGQLDRLVVSPKEDAPALRAPTRSKAVTIAYQRFWYPPGRYFALRFFGQISSGAADEYVFVMHKPCRATNSTSIAGATTTAGAAGKSSQRSRPGPVSTARAGTTSSRSQLCTSLPWSPTCTSGRSGRSARRCTPLSGPGAKPVILTGRWIELQRLNAAGQWIRIRCGKLAGFGANLYNRTYFANFTVPRGLTLRAFVPAKTAVPYWTSAVSKTFKS